MQTFRKRIPHLVAVTVCLAVAAAPSSAQRPAITLTCGGIGAEESQAMLAAEKSHALTVVFATSEGSWLAGVDTRVDDPLADLQAQARCGPLGLVEVPVAGRYRVVATYRGETREQWVDLTPGGGARLVLRWSE